MKSKSQRFPSLQKEQIPFFSTCQRFQSISNQIFDKDHALTFLSLRDKCCERNRAAKFVSKAKCKFDITLQRDGPMTCRVLKPVKQKNIPQIHGWANIGKKTKYELGKFYECPSKNIEQDADLQKNLKLIEFQEQRANQEYLQSLQSIQNLFNNDEYDFSPENRSVLINKLRILKAKNHSQEKVVVNYAKCNGSLLINSVKEVLEDKLYRKRNRGSIIMDLQSFKPMIPFDEKQTPIKQRAQNELYKKVKLDEHDQITVDLAKEQRKRDSIIMQRFFNQSAYLIAESDKSINDKMKLITPNRTQSQHLYEEIKYFILKTSECPIKISSTENIQRIMEMKESDVVKESLRTKKIRDHLSSNSSITTCLTSRRASQPQRKL